MDESVRDEPNRELGTKQIGTLFAKYGTTTLMGMMAQAAMVMFEGITIGNGLGAEGLATVSIIMPLELLDLALGGALSMGISSAIAIKLGEGNLRQAQKVFSDGFWISVIITVILSMIIGLNAEAVGRLLGASATLLPSVRIFIHIFMLGYPFCMLGQILCSVLRVDEKPGIATGVMIAASIFAMAILFYTVIIAKMGIKGVGIYYAFSIGSWSFSVFYFLFSSTRLKIRFDFEFEFKEFFKAFKIGLPFFIVQITSFAFTWTANVLLARVGNDVDVAAFGIINSYIFYDLNLITTALTNGMQPIASFNFGARYEGRLKQLVKVSTISNFSILLVVTLVFILLPTQIIGLFVGNDPELIHVASRGAMVMISCSAFGLTSNLMSGYYQAVNKTKVSVLLGVSRFLFLAIPLMVIFSSVFGVDGIWASQPVADLIIFLVTVVVIRKELETNVEVSDRREK